MFARLFDCSRDIPQSSDNGLDYAASAVSWLPGPVAKTVGTGGSLFGRKYLEHLSPLPEAVKKSLHLVAAHERRRLESIRSGIMASAGASMGLASITPQARQAAEEISEELRILNKHWGWLSDVVSAADVLLTRRLHHPPQLFMKNIHEPACARAAHFLECGTAGFDGKPLPVMWYNAPNALYAWFLHDVQRRETLSDAYFSVRWMEPRE